MTDKRKLVVIAVLPGSRLLTLAGPVDVFAFANSMLQDQHGKGYTAYDIRVVSATPAAEVKMNSPLSVMLHGSIYDIHQPIDTLITVGWGLPAGEPVSTKFYQWLSQHASSIRRVAAVCVGTFVLARAGLLHNKRATTHWEAYDRLREQFPDTIVDTTPFYIKDGNIYTAGGVTSGMDLALAMVEEDYGREVALKVARKLVIHLKRPGNQKQFGGLLPNYEVNSPLLLELRPWLLEHIHEDLSVEKLADKVHMSARNFARVFLKETGLTPAKFIEKLRVELARNYLENSPLSLEEIALKCGLGGLVSLRRVFLRHLEISPGTYRATFRTSLLQE
ncbi:MAG: GlxA family transcriptional regulator [Chitinophaga sp.]|uniref:GlxA family transcriptional regulator n=1 Tax=Chitinophaga sp. TaxID=1869181 RepID=UPI0025BACA0E|nr:GlxA family transcriptional regulator [Chitinophaga sp.]MBV8253632.1 GlxA family transcriptional regulator [Chitinophaga sp.]